MAIKRKIKRNQEAQVITYWEAVSMFIEEKEAINLSAESIKDYKKILRYIGNYFGFDENSPVGDITLQHFYQLTNHCKATGAAPATVQNYIRMFRVFAYWCMDDVRKYIEPAYKIKLPKAAEEQIKFFTDEEVALLLEKPKRDASFVEWRYWAIANWVLATGNRASTLLDVRVSDIDYKRKEIILHHTKSGRAQIIPLSSTLEMVLKEYVRMWRKDAPEDAYLFPNVGEEKLQVNSLSGGFNDYCKKRGVGKTSIHGLRHTFARMWVKNNGNLFQLQKILGHSTLEMTKRYSRLFGEDLKDDFDLYSPLDTISRSRKRTQLVKNRQ